MGYILLSIVMTVLTACGGNVITPEAGISTPNARPSSPTPDPTGLHPTSMAPIVTPITTATLTVTPTPMVHVVQSGDTLLGIALDYGVDVDALQAINGIDNPLALQVGQELVIPTGQEEAMDAPGLLLPTPTPLTLGVRGVAFHETPVGSLWCLGEVVNTANADLTNVQVRVTLFNENGEIAAEVDAFAAVELIPPGERSPFSILFTSPPASWTSPQVMIIRAETAGELADTYVPITLAQVEGQTVDPQFQVNGTVQNASGERTAQRVMVYVTTYDSQGNVTGIREVRVEMEEPLAPGGTAPFSLLFAYHGDPPTDYHVFAQGHVNTQ